MEKFEDSISGAAPLCELREVKALAMPITPPGPLDLRRDAKYKRARLSSVPIPL